MRKLELDEDLKDEVEGTKKPKRISDYLAEPRKKKKFYVVMALSKNFDKSLAISIENLILNQFKGYEVVRPRVTKDLAKFENRHVNLLLMDDKFAGINQNLDNILKLKKANPFNNVPTLFLTENPDKLVEAYYKKLHLYQESDDYVTHTKINRKEFFDAVIRCLTSGSKRRSRRYSVNILVRFFNLSKEHIFDGRIVDLSLHGATMKAEEKCVFRIGDQLRISFPASGLSTNGDFIKISCRVRRVFISGDIVAVNWEYMSEDQRNYITRYLTRQLESQMTRRAKHIQMEMRRLESME